jgi:hypothetical protein
MLFMIMRFMRKRLVEIPQSVYGIQVIKALLEFKFNWRLQMDLFSVIIIGIDLNLTS